MRIEKGGADIINSMTGVAIRHLDMIPHLEKKVLIMLNANVEKGVAVKYAPAGSTSIIVKEYDVVLDNEVFEELLSALVGKIERFLKKKREIKK